VHDEWQIEVEEAYADMVGKLGVQAIEQAGRVLEMRCPLTGEYRVGNSWKETH
jgi:DNA polymerase-1